MATVQSSVITNFGRDSTAADVIDGVDLSGRRALVTGGASGIGIETARALASAGAQVTLAVRDIAAGTRAVTDIVARTGNGQVFIKQIDLAAPTSIAAFVAGWKGPLDMLVNNAGVMAFPARETTATGCESHFASNHLGHFALAVELRDALAAADRARIVAVSSNAHLLSPVVFDDIHFKHRPYDRWFAYGQSKTANSLFAVEATRRWADDGITANALMPGAIRTNLWRHTSDEELDAALADRGGIGSIRWKSVEQGAATSVLLAASPLLDGIGGRYFEDCNEAKPHEVGGDTGVAAHALDGDAAARLWDVSLQMLRA